MASKERPLFQGIVLIVDDSSANRDLCRICLELEGFQVHLAEDGGQGIDAVRRLRPDVVLLDIMMPGMDGFQILKNLKSDTNTAGIPVLVHSVLSKTQEIVKALETGADDFLKKPCDVDELIARVKKMIVFKHGRDALLDATRTLINRQRAIDVALKKWGREAEDFRQQCEAAVVNILAGTEVASKLERALLNSEQARRLISSVVDLSNLSLLNPESLLN